MKQTQQQIEKLRTIQESLDFYADVAENQLPLLSKESTLQEESAAIQSKIDGLSTTFDDIYAQQLESIIG